MSTIQQHTAHQCNPASSALSLSVASAADWPALARLWRRAMLSAGPFQPSEDIDVIEPLLASHYFAPLTLLRAQQANGELAGFIGCLHEQIEMLFVDPAQQRQGVASALLQHAINRHQARTVEVYAHNAPALALYRRHGFNLQQQRPCDGAGRPWPVLTLRLDTRC